MIPVNTMTSDELRELSNVIDSMSIEDLIKLRTDLIGVSDLKGTSQGAKKVLLNSLYGALGNDYFRHYRLKDAEAITKTGQYGIRYLGERLSRYIGELTDKVSDDEYKNLLIYSDTDSITYTSNLRINSQIVQIGRLWDDCDSEIIVTDRGNEIKSINNMSTPTITDDGEFVHRNVPWVMRHKVEKRMFRITVNDKSVEVTEDHSIIILRDGELLDITPRDIIKGDKIITLK